MRKITFGKTILQVEGLEVKFDVVPVSSSFALLIGDRDSASIVQQLYYWTEQGYGEVIDGVRWIYKSIDEWIREVFPTFTPWKLGKMMRQLDDRGIIRREKLFTKHQIQNGDRFWWQPKNQTYYYSVNYDKLQELADNLQSPETAETTETTVSIKTQILSNEEIKDTKDFDYARNNTNNTSIENNSIEQSHPHLPCVSEKEKDNSKERKNSRNPKLDNQKQINSANSEAIAQDTNVGQVDQKINKVLENNCTVENDVEIISTPKPKTKTPKGTKPNRKRRNEAPWKDEGQFKRFYRALIQALPIVANARSAPGLAQVIIKQLRSGIPHTYWDDFAAGLPIGTSDKPEWEVEPGVPYPQFFEYLTEKIIRGNNSQTNEQARNEVFRILDKPRQAKAFWGQFKRSVVNVSEQVERDRALGVSNPNTPVWTRERIEPSIEEAAEAGKKIMAVNGATQAVIESAQTPQLENKDSPTSTSLSKSEEVSPPPDPWSDCPKDTHCDRAEPQLSMREMLAERGVKGFCKPMPKVSQAEVAAEERKQKKPKTNIAQMSLAEINDYLTDPVFRSQLTLQLIDSDYELITDELGQIIRVELSEAHIREMRRLERESS